MPGLISAAINKTDPLKSIAGYEAEKVALDPTKDTVEGRIESIINKDSPLMTQAATRGKQYANTRGLLNSSIAAGATQQAVLDAALPIASQDASTSVNVKQNNAQAGNQALQTTSANQTQAALTHYSGLKETELQQLRGDQAENIAGIEASYKNLIQGSQSASSFFTQMSADISRILADPEIPAAQKQQLIDKQVELLQGGLAVIGGIANLDLSNLLVFN